VPSERPTPHGFRHLRACTLLLICASCTGEVEGPSRRGPGSAGVGSPGAPGSALDPAAADQAMQARNPELFELAKQYFPGETSSGGQKRLFRLTREQLDLTTATLLPGLGTTSAREAMPRDPLETNYEYAANLSWNAANFTPYTDWVTDLAGLVRASPTSVIDCESQQNAVTCLQSQARSFLGRAFRSVTTETQLARFTDFFVASVSTVGLPDATADLVDLTLTSPSYVFREEVQTDAQGTLLPAQLLQSLTYTLADVPPEALGLSSGDAPALVGTPEALQGTVERVLAAPEARDKLVRFFLAWLEVRAPDELGIALNVFPEFTAEVAQAAVADTTRFLEQKLAAAAPRLTDLTHSTEAFASAPTAFLYGSSGASDGTLVPLDPAQRLGIFSQPAVIASHSGPTTTRLVKRGVFFTRKVMCLPLGAPPPGIDTTVPTTPGATERQRIESITTGQPCAGCHAFINPFGFMQENYDAIGRWRTTDEGLPIDASIMVDFLDEGPLSASSPVDALRGLTSSARFQQCFARQLYRFYLGRDEGAGDDPVLRQMFFSFADQGAQDILAMLRAFAASPSLSQRSEAP
jgi:hypothetical protein